LEVVAAAPVRTPQRSQVPCHGPRRLRRTLQAVDAQWSWRRARFAANFESRAPAIVRGASRTVAMHACGMRPIRFVRRTPAAKSVFRFT
jgi:hypothetical protein